MPKKLPKKGGKQPGSGRSKVVDVAGMTWEQDMKYRNEMKKPVDQRYI